MACGTIVPRCVACFLGFFLCISFLDCSDARVAAPRIRLVSSSLGLLGTLTNTAFRSAAHATSKH
jgi:hypothetical protein